MNVNYMTRQEFRAVPWREDWLKEVRCHSLVIIPANLDGGKGVHDSGYRCMSFVAVSRGQEPVCQLGGCSDVIHIDGIAGAGD